MDIDDIATPKLFLATAKWVFSVDLNVKPYHNYKVRTDTYNYISATILPEAISYPSNSEGLVSSSRSPQINKAHDMYNSRVEKPYNWEARAKDSNIYCAGWS